METNQAARPWETYAKVLSLSFGIPVLGGLALWLSLHSSTPFDPNFTPQWTENSPGLFEIQYGPDPLQTADLHYDFPGQPLVLLVHGGDSSEGKKSNMKTRWEMYNSLGLNVLVPDYRYGHNATTDKPLPSHDVWCALSTTLQLTADHDVNFPEINVHGYSYGGYVSSLMVYNQDFDWATECTSKQNFPVAHFIGESTNYGNPEAEADTYKDTLAPRDGAINYLDPSDPPALLFHGTDDPKFNPQRMLDFEAALKKAGLTAQSFIVPNRGHGVGLPFNSSFQSTLKDFIVGRES